MSTTDWRGKFDESTDLPIDESVSYLYGWLAGYFAADGCVAEDGTVILNSADRADLEFVADEAAQILRHPGLDFETDDDAAAALLFEAGDEQKKRDYAAAIADPSHAVTAGFVDAVIRPAATRQTIAAALRHAAPAQEFGSMLPKPSPTGAGHTRERDRNG